MNKATIAAKRWWYIMPIVFITYSLAYLDRANFSFASAAGINDDLGITKGMSSLLGALFFLGYFFFQIPGAIYAERRSVKKLIFWCLILWGGCASLTGMVSNIPMLAAIRFILGVVEAAVMPAMLIYISNWFTKSERSRANTFLILGNPVTVLWMSVVSGYLIHAFGWREMYQLAAVSIAVITVIMWKALPRFTVHSTLSYPSLMLSMVQLWQRYSTLRRAALAQGFLSIAFSAFWSTLAVMLSEHYHLGSAIAGAFGIAGAAGALAAPMAGHLADKVGAAKVTQLGALLVTVSFALMFLLPALPVQGQWLLIALSAVGFDLGLQSSLVAHQNLVYSLEPQARGRLNALLFTMVFIGMALGSVLGSQVYALANWEGVVTLATFSSAIALVIRLTGNPSLSKTSVA